MSYRTLMVHLQLGQSNANLLQVTSNIAKQYQCAVIGIVAAQPLEVIYADGCYIAGDVIQQYRDQLEADINAAEIEFRHGLQHGPGPLAWRSSVTLEPLAGFMAHEARSADLILTGIAPKLTRGEPGKLRVGDLVMEAGRPLLIIPASMQTANTCGTSASMLAKDWVVFLRTTGSVGGGKVVSYQEEPPSAE